jgi:hypothetical protein
MGLQEADMVTGPLGAVRSQTVHPKACAIRDSYEAPIYTAQEYLSIDYSLALASHFVDSTCHRSSTPYPPWSGDAPSFPQIHSVCNRLLRHCQRQKMPHFVQNSKRMHPTATHCSQVDKDARSPGFNNARDPSTKLEALVQLADSALTTEQLFERTHSLWPLQINIIRGVCTNT